MASVNDGPPYASMAGRLDDNLLLGLQANNFTNMTPVQYQVLTTLPDWSADCLVQAKTGTGKTLAFLLPSLHCLLQSSAARARGQVAILIVTPTRELAQQIAVQCDQLTSQLPRRLECHVAVGGTARASALNKFVSGDPAVLVATPGRLLDYLNDAQTSNKFNTLQTLILDEADTMLESGFLPDVKRVLSLLPPKAMGWQGMCFSATVPQPIRNVVNIVLRTGHSVISTVDPNEQPTHERVPQFCVTVPELTDTFTALAAVLALESQACPKIIVFGVTANLVALYARAFEQGLVNLPTFEIHSRLSQSARTKTTSQFKDATSGVMFASDVIGRGMDFPNVDLVVQVGLPSSSDQYVHRVGRTARAGNDGRAIILLTSSESYFVPTNSQFPINPYPQQSEVLQTGQQMAPDVQNAMENVAPQVKQRAYSSYIGFLAGSSHMRKMRLDKPGLVQLANDFAIRGMGCPEPPPMEKRTVGKMGLKGVPGFNYATGDASDARPQQRFQARPGQARQNPIPAWSPNGNQAGEMPDQKMNGFPNPNGVSKSGGRGGRGGGRGRGGAGRGNGNGSGGSRGRPAGDAPVVEYPSLS